MKNFKKIINILFLIMMIYIIVLLFCFDGLHYYLKQPHLINNIFSVIFIILILILVYFFKIKNISNKKFYIILFFLIFITNILQVFIVKYGWFNTCWDVKEIRIGVNAVVNRYNFPNLEYFTRYQNNLFLVFILALIRKIPMIGFYYSTTLYINCLLVNLSSLFACLTVRNILKNNLWALLSYLILTLLINLNPWIIIPYSDTFAILFPILALYIYSKDVKRPIDYFIIGFCIIFGFLIKPTVIIIFIAFIISEIINTNYKNLNFKKYALKLLIVFCGMIFAYSLKYVSLRYIHFVPDNSVKQFDYTHYLSMGQNNDTNGVYSQKDVDDSAKYGMKINLKKFKDRMGSRNFKEHLAFYSKKTLINYNESSFAWGAEGGFYCEVPVETNSKQHFIRNIYYQSGKYYKYFMLILQWIWLFTILMCPFIVNKKLTKKEHAIMLSIMGITLFLTIFECRTRYLFCFSPIYVVCCMIGLKNLKDIFLNYSKR